MITPTHLIFGQAAFYAVCIFTGHSPTYQESLAAAVFSVIPADLDTRQSLVGRLFYPLAAAIEHEFGHRGFTHSLLAQVVVGLLAFHYLPYGYALALVSGWVSHSFADMMSAKGVCWFWPSRVRCVLPGSADFRMNIMGWGELWFAALMLAALIPLKSMAVTGQGATGLIRQAIGDVAAARQTYEAQKGANVWWLEVVGKDNVTLAEINGRYEILAGHMDSGFLLQTPQGRKTACKAPSCDWYADTATAHRGEAQAATTYTVAREALDGDALRAAVLELEQGGAVYVTGELLAGEPRKTLTLRYAPASEIPPGPLAQVNLSVQVRHPPGAAVPALTVQESAGPGPVKAVDPLLEKWL